MPGQPSIARCRRPIGEYPTWRLGIWSAVLFVMAMVGVLW